MTSLAENVALAAEHFQRGRFADAEKLCREILSRHPLRTDVLNWLGLIELQSGRVAAAEGRFRQALQLSPAQAGLHVNFGNALQAQGHVPEAIASFRQALALKPEHAIAHLNLGNALQAQGNLSAAAESFQQALRWKPDYAKAHFNLGLMLRSLGRLDEAAQCFQRYLQLQPNSAEGHNELGVTWKIKRRLGQAETSLRHAVGLKPDSAEAHQNLALVLKNQGRLPEAIASFQNVLRLRPDNPAALGQLVHLQQTVCDWVELCSLTERLLTALETQQNGSVADYCSAFGVLSLMIPTTPAQQLKCAVDWSRTKYLVAPGNTKSEISPARPADSRLKIGYLSGDFRSHPVAYLAAELLEQHDRSRFIINAYSYGYDDASSIRNRLVNGVDRFVDLEHASFEQAAARIAEDRVDVLVDLTGYTQQARTQILSLRPAPIQVNYLGYPGTMGAPFIDYILVDDFVVPEDQRPYFTEHLVYLPDCYQVNDSQRKIAEDSPTRAISGLPENGFVFGCFNNNFKITPGIFDIWMRLLSQTPGSVLWLLASNPAAAANLRAAAVTRGVAPERLIFAPRVTLEQHLARHRLVDLFLDTFPYTGHTTTSDLLWVGCPVVTMIGETFSSRVAGSLLRTIGVPELITRSQSEYFDLAARLSCDPVRLSELRRKIAVNRVTSPLFDAKRFARHVEQAYTQMFEISAAGLPPRTFRIAPAVS